MFEAYCREKIGPLVLRIALGLVCAYHGFLKITSHGGMEWAPGMAVGWQLLIAWGEFCGGAAILVGFYCRWAALLVLIVTIAELSWARGWTVFKLPLTHLEPLFMLLLMGVALLFLGAGEMSIDGRLGLAGGRGAKRK